MKKTYLIIIIIIVILVVGGIYYFIKIQKPPAGPESENPPIIEDKITREEIVDDFPKKIADISPAKPVLGGSWYINRFWFIQNSNKDFYAEYEDGHIMRQILVEARKVYPERSRGEDDKLEYKVIGYFEPGENDWILKKGEDKFSGVLLDLYEHSEELGRWVKKN